jgi:hypothetical protein
MIKNKICYWSIGWKDYSFMVQSLINSKIKYGIEGDFIAFTDTELKNCINEKLDPNIPLDLRNYMFKFAYLHKLLKYDYDYFIFVDADSMFINEPDISPLIFMEKSPWHCFLESPINSPNTRRSDWWGVRTNALTQMYRSLGVISEEIRNMNAGYWICKKDFIQQACDLGFKCFNYFKTRGFNITEEIPMAYISNYMCADVSFHFHEKYANYWASDWIGTFRDQLPFYKPWQYESYMTGEKFTVNPCLIHAMRSKNALIENGKNLL